MRRIFFLAGLSALASVASFPPPARAEGDTGNLAQGLGFSGSVRTGYWSANRNLDAKANFAATSLWLKTQRDIGNGFYVSAEGWLLDERAFNGGARQQGELREGYFGWRDDKIEVSVGRRIINWGRVDWFNPTDVISPRDYTILARSGFPMASCSSRPPSIQPSVRS